MNYFLRCIEQDRAQLMGFGLLLGIFQEVEVPWTKEVDGQEVSGTDKVLMPAPGITWDVIGSIMQPTGLTEGDPPVPVMAPKKDINGNIYWHANLYNVPNLKEIAQSKAKSHPELGPAMQNLGRFFLLDAEGNARAPSQPYRVVAGWAPPMTEAEKLALTQLPQPLPPEEPA